MTAGDKIFKHGLTIDTNSGLQNLDKASKTLVGLNMNVFILL